MLGKVLIIGDQNKEGGLLKEALKKTTHYSVYQQAKNDLSLEAVAEKEPDVLILNPKDSYVEMMDLYYGLKKDERLKDLIIVLMVDDAQAKSLDIPPAITEVLFRPLRIQETLTRVDLLFKRINRVDCKDRISKGSLSIDISRYEVHVSGKKIDLTFTEFELLRFLSANPGTVFTREVLLNKVWGYEYYGGTRTVDVHIRRLRSKIESKSTVFIETIRNIGYKFISQDA